MTTTGAKIEKVKGNLDRTAAEISKILKKRLLVNILPSNRSTTVSRHAQPSSERELYFFHAGASEKLLSFTKILPEEFPFRYLCEHTKYNKS